MRKIKAITPTTSGDRFDLRSFLPVISDDNLMAQDSLKNGFFIELCKLPVAGQFTIIDEAADWALVSYKLFKTTTLWWILCFYNAYDNPADLAQGDVIRYPSVADVDVLFFKYSRKNIQLAPQEMLPDRAGFIDYPYYLFYHDSFTWVRRTPSGTFAVFQVEGEYVAKIDDDGNLEISGSLTEQTDEWFEANLATSDVPVYYNDPYGVVFCVRRNEMDPDTLKPVFYPVFSVARNGAAYFRHQVSTNCLSGATVIEQTPTYPGVAAIEDYTDISMNGDYNVIEFRSEIVPSYSSTTEGFHMCVRGSVTAPSDFDLEVL